MGSAMGRRHCHWVWEPEKRESQGANGPEREAGKEAQKWATVRVTAIFSEVEWISILYNMYMLCWASPYTFNAVAVIKNMGWGGLQKAHLKLKHTLSCCSNSLSFQPAIVSRNPFHINLSQTNDSLWCAIMSDWTHNGLCSVVKRRRLIKRTISQCLAVVWKLKETSDIN